MCVCNTCYRVAKMARALGKINYLALFMAFTFNELILMLNERNSAINCNWARTKHSLSLTEFPLQLTTTASNMEKKALVTSVYLNMIQFALWLQFSIFRRFRQIDGFSQWISGLLMKNAHLVSQLELNNRQQICISTPKMTLLNN